LPITTDFIETSIQNAQNELKNSDKIISTDEFREGMWGAQPPPLKKKKEAS
jgi:hypothetical protein